MRFKRHPLPRGAVLLTVLGVLVAAVVATPSLAGSFLSRQAATHKFLTKKDAHKLYQRDDKQSPFDPVAAAVSSNSAFATTSVTGVQLPSTNASFKLKEPGLVVLTFSGADTCTATTAGVPCPILIQVDAQNVSTGKANLDLSTTSGSTQPVVHTVTQTVFLSKGTHTVTAFYAGSNNASLNFKLTNWNLIAEAYPGT
jgi:hypothetical protein